jgi:hypothetical protein
MSKATNDEFTKRKIDNNAFNEAIKDKVLML